MDYRRTNPLPYRRTTPLVACLAVGIASNLRADTVFDEAALGDFSNDGLAPTSFLLGAGTNELVGTFGISPVPDQHDLDYVSVTVPDGYLLSRLVLVDAFAGGAFSFVGLQAGPAVTVPPDNQSINTPLLGWAHFGSASIGQDLFPGMAASPGSVGFTAPLAAGTYSLWIMELNTSEAYSYRFGLEVVAIPGPGVLGAAAVFAGGFRRLAKAPRRVVAS
jgi:hypothetical protein